MAKAKTNTQQVKAGWQWSNSDKAIKAARAMAKLPCDTLSRPSDRPQAQTTHAAVRGTRSSRGR
jgi:hypothetical protein